jgi:hypothetical protein
MLLRWLHRLTAILLTGILLFALLLPQAAIAEGWDTQIPSTIYQGAPVPDWGRISLSNLPVLQDGGTLQIPESLADQLGYNPSRIWQAGATIGDVLMLGDVQDAFQLQAFTLNHIAQIAELNLDRISLSNFPLIQRQTIAALVNAIPDLGRFTLNQVRPLEDLVTLNLRNLALDHFNRNDWGNQPLSTIAADTVLGQFSLGDLSQHLDQYSFTQIPGLDQIPIDRLQDWQSAFISEIPGLVEVPMANYPNAPFSRYYGFVAVADVAYGPMEHRQTPTRHSITGSDRVGFHYQCAQARGCSNLELNSPADLGMAGDPGLHGAQWIKGGTSSGGQMVSGGEGVLGAINNGVEPTGRLPFGSAFKVVLIDTDESEGTGKFGLYFRVCHRGVPDLGCTPYFIGPVPWFSVREKGLVFVGLTPGTPPENIPQPPPLPPEVQQQIDDLIEANAPEGDSAATAIQLDGDCVAKVMAKVPASDRAYAVQVVPALLREAQRARVTDPAQIAYILATVQAETNFHARNEEGGYCGRYGSGCFFGRGLVQVTWESNYRDWSNRLGMDFIHHPELMNRPDIAAKIAVVGMRDGTFTHHRLGQYIHGSTHDFVNARRIVNDSDRSREIAAYADRYLTALSQCRAIATTQATGITSATHPGQLISRSNGNATQQRIVNAINAHYNESTAAGPDGGNLACAWEVNRVLQDAIGHTIGGAGCKDSVNCVDGQLRAGAGTRINPSQAHAGDVVVWYDHHIGFCINDGCSQVVSNSSSAARFRWTASRSSVESYFGVGSRIYRVNP